MMAGHAQSESTGKSLAELGLVTADNPQARISGVAVQSRDVRPGHLFAAVPGSNVHGAEFVGDAVSRGAAAVVTDRHGFELMDRRGFSGCVETVIVEEPRKALAVAAARWFAKSPETVVAVTGTNGKSSVASMCRQIWELLGRSAASAGTLGIEGSVELPLRHTTPDPVQMFRLLSDMQEGGITHLALEASSHGLVQHRITGIKLAAAAFTNLTHEHLDYHGSMASYFDAKARLFECILPAGRVAAIWTDSEFGRQMARRASDSGRRVISLGGDGADVRILSTSFDRDGQLLKFDWKGQQGVVRLLLPGEFQAQNALTAAALAVAAGEEIEEVLEVLPGLQPVRGRLELAATRRNGSSVYVDYAHTPDALKTVMKALRRHHLGRLIVVFGAGGERDQTKRRPMGRTVACLADAALITDDNPRNENPATIRAEILGGCPGGIEISDRAEAIARGIDMLQPGDVLLIAGKGHETGQEIAGVMHPFNDAEQASIAVRALDGLAT